VVSAPVSISSDAARRLGAEFRAAPPSGAPAAATAAVAQTEIERVTDDMSAVAVTVPVDTVNVKTSQSSQSTRGVPSPIPPSTIAPSTPTPPAPTVVNNPRLDTPFPKDVALPKDVKVGKLGKSY
jgi:hypothetical protein